MTCAGWAKNPNVIFFTSFNVWSSAMGLACLSILTLPFTPVENSTLTSRFNKTAKLSKICSYEILVFRNEVKVKDLVKAKIGYAPKIGNHIVKSNTTLYQKWCQSFWAGSMYIGRFRSFHWGAISLFRSKGCKDVARHNWRWLQNWTRVI